MFGKELSFGKQKTFAVLKAKLHTSMYAAVHLKKQSSNIHRRDQARKLHVTSNALSSTNSSLKSILDLAMLRDRLEKIMPIKTKCAEIRKQVFYKAILELFKSHYF